MADALLDTQVDAKYKELEPWAQLMQRTMVSTRSVYKRLLAPFTAGFAKGPVWLQSYGPLALLSVVVVFVVLPAAAGMYTMPWREVIQVILTVGALPIAIDYARFL